MMATSNIHQNYDVRAIIETISHAYRMYFIAFENIV